jgi:PAS domain S-box-containing protein
MKHSVRLAIAFFVLSTLPVAFVSYVSTLSTERSIEQESENHLFAITEMREADYDRWARSLERMIESIAQRTLVADLATAAVEQARGLRAADPSVQAQLVDAHLLPNLRADNLYESLSLVDAETGRIVVSSEAEQVGKFRIGEADFERGRYETYVDHVKFAPAMERLTMHVGTPVGASAVLIGRVALDVLAEIVSYAEDAHESEDVYFVNPYGFFVTEPRFGEGYALRRTVDSEGVSRALAGESGVAQYADYRGMQVLGAYRWIEDHRMALLAEIDISEAFAPVAQARRTALLALIGAIVVFSSLGFLLARSMTNPLRRIAAGAAKIGKGEFGHRIRLRRTDEFGDLARSFDEMAENLQVITASRDDLNREMARRREAEDELRASEAKFRDLVEEIHEVIYAIDAEGTVTYVSPSVERLIGYRPEELIGKLYSSFGFSDDLPTISEMEGVFGRTTDLTPQHYRLVAKDGSICWVRTASHPIIEDGRFVGLHGVLIDVTEAKRSEEALRVSEQRYRSLFENAALGIYQTTPDGRILAANPAMVRMLGYESFEELAARNLEEEGYEPETPRERFKELMEHEGRLEGVESTWIRKDGEHLHVRENAVAIRDDDGNVILYEGTVEDVTARRQAEEDRRALEARLRQTQRLESIGTLASGVAHEINNPLTGMINYAELIGRRVENHRLKEFAEAIMSEGARVAKIVRNLLSFSRQEKESHSPARLVDIVSTARTMVDQLLRKDHILLEVRVPEDLPSFKCRSQQIQQVVLNLLTNARDALNERFPGVDPEKQLRIAAVEIEEGGARWLRLTVEDRGVGISEEHIGRVFDPFFTTKPRERGTGLGLSVSYGIVRDHGGRLTVESEEGSFTRFTLDLPVDNEWRLKADGEPREGDG